ncbi:predicted protein [Phaeodactylum tricornutum CCAP 1055/1]|uniref:GCK domain-containing protein n=1 Tax=Phaeodactylum tricornutum (strain CCAP 1055/1) TaxID=556484 RepID=B7G6T8_PHATC|nr:predicted protein [Phaeodactylum tricornutum CCAP 1055/1]EEC45651.1 predicted protein [Phaeodactylum tricornutum CCAP 1055/1]|eukprot:XP_002182915.1 predicted protein [Phaeodactylum tricornutum CCAP 1055/1]
MIRHAVDGSVLRKRPITSFGAALLGGAWTSRNRIVIACDRHPPQRWLLPTRSCATTVAPEDFTLDDSCPLCRQFRQGPCAAPFNSWYACTERANAASQDHVAVCSESFAAFHACVASNETFYDRATGPDQFHSSGPDESAATATDVYTSSCEAWQELIDNDLADVKRLDFPSHLRPVWRTSADSRLSAEFVVRDLVLVYVEALESDNSRIMGARLIAAGAKADMTVIRDRKETDLVSFAIPSASNRWLRISAVYEDSDDVVVYEMTLRVP